MSSYKRHGRRNKNTRPFMPVHGKRSRRLHDGEAPAKTEAAAAGEECHPEPLEPEVEKLVAERDSYLEMARRERADFDNYRKRTERDMQQLKRESLASFLKEFFGPLDDLDRVLAESAKNHSYDSLEIGRAHV